MKNSAAKIARTTAAILLATGITVAGVTSASAATDMNGVQGVVFGTGSPNYSITLNCNDLGWGFDDTITAVSGGSFTINMDDVCLNGAFGNTFYFMVLDDAQFAGDPGYTEARVHHVGIVDSTPVAITGTITVDPDTIIQIRAMNNGSIIPDTFTMHYAGDPAPAPTPTPMPATLPNTGFDSTTTSLVAGGFIALGLAFRLRPRPKRQRQH